MAWFGAIQAQDYTGAKWALGLRTRNLTDTIIEQAFNEGRILRTHLLRPTWHFVTPQDILWMLALTGRRVQIANRTYAAKLGLDDRVLARARKVIERVLAGGRHLTRDELSSALRTARIEAAGSRLAHLLLDLEVQAVVCSGPRRGKQPTYALLSERAPQAAMWPREEALGRLAIRYFQSHGPATLKDFAWWSGLAMKEAREAVALGGVDVLHAPLGPDRSPGATYLLPNYDEYLVAYRNRAAVIDPARTRNLGVFTSLEYPHHVIVDGRVAGSWRRRLTSGTLTIDVRTYTRPSPAVRRRLQAEGERYAAFLQATGEVRFDG